MKCLKRNIKKGTSILKFLFEFDYPKIISGLYHYDEKLKSIQLDNIL